mgnify:FL=1
MIARTPEEIALLRESGKRLATHVRTLAAMVKPGITPAQLEDAAHAMVEKDGDTLAFLGYRSHGEKHGYPSALCISINDAIVHEIGRAHV